jgi:hypothetical protein
VAPKFAALLEGARGAAGTKGISKPHASDVGDDTPKAGRRFTRERAADARAEASPELSIGLARVLAPPPSSIAAPTSPATAHAETAALAERMLTSLRVGRVDRDAVEVHMRLRHEDGEVEVRLRERAGRLEAELIGEGAPSDLSALAGRVEAELRSRGYELDALDVTTG